MPRLTENVLIGERVRLAGEDISEADAKSVRPEVFASKEAPAADEPKSEPKEGDDSSKSSDAVKEAPAADEPAKASRARGKGTSTK